MIRILGTLDSKLGYFILPGYGGEWQTDFDINQQNSYGLFPYEMPPPDGEWYPFGEKYGIVSREMDIDFFNKERSHRSFKNAFHGKISGTLKPKCASVSSPCPNFGGSVFFRNVWDGSGFTPPDFAAYATSEGGFLHLDSFSESTTPFGKQVLLGSQTTAIEVTGIPGNWWESSDPWTSDVGWYPIFSTGSNVTTWTGKSFSKTTLFEMCGKYPDDWGVPQPPPWISGIPYVQMGYRSVKTVHPLAIRNLGSYGELQLDVKWNFMGLDDPSLPPYFEDGVDSLIVPLWFGDFVSSATHPDSQGLFRTFALSSLSHPTEREQIKVRTQALINNEDLGMNNIENALGIPNVLDIIKLLVEGYKAFKNLNVRAALKFLCDAYLTYKFAIAATVSDVQKIAKVGPDHIRKLQDPDAFITRRRETQLFAHPHWGCSRSSTRFSSMFILKLNPDAVSQLINALDDIGLLPSASNLWALVPLSFVVDWFLNVEGVLEAFRLGVDQETYTLLSRVESHRFEFVGNQELVSYLFSPSLCAASPLQGSVFYRVSVPDWGQIDPFSLAGSSGLGFSQMITGFALTVQRIG